MKRASLSLLLAGAMALSANAAYGQESLTYLFPAPDFLPAFAPFQLALHKGYYKEEGLDVEFRVGQGGADVATQVAVGNADMGGGMGDTSMIVRSNGLEVRGVALLGGKGLTQLAWRNDSGIKSVADLKGQSIAVITFQDTAYYNLLAALASEGINRSDADIQALGSGGLIQAMIGNTVQAMSGVPEWIVSIQDAGVDLTVKPVSELFPAQPQAIIASDRFIAENPEKAAGFVRATLRAIEDIVADPAVAAKEYAGFVEQHAENVDQVERIMRFYAENVYPAMDGLPRGAFNTKQLQEIQEFYLANDIITTAVPIEDVYTNQFVTE